MRITLLIALLVIALPLAAQELDGDRLELHGGQHDADLTVGLRGGSILAHEPTRLDGRVELASAGERGLTASVVLGSLRRVREDDWRESRKIVGSRQDEQIDFSGAMGSTEEHATWNIAGSPGNWDAVSIQWDGHILIPDEGYQLATASDDGSRLWLDRNGDGVVDQGEWGNNGWGRGQGTTRRRVQNDLPAGLHRFRLQWEEGGGGNSCTLLWRPGRGRWQTVPPEAFRAGARLRLDGPIALAAEVGGQGSLVLGDGVVLGQRPEVAELWIAGAVTIDRDLDLRGLPLRLRDGARLRLQNAELQVDDCSGAGAIVLDGATLRLPPGDHAFALRGEGRLRIDGDGDCSLAGLDDLITVSGGNAWAPKRGVFTGALLSPLATVIPCSLEAPGPRLLMAIVDLPAETPADLSLAVWRSDRQGRWFQHPVTQTLGPGRHLLHLPLADQAPLIGVGHHGVWSADTASDAERIGFFFTSAEHAAGLQVAVDARIEPLRTRLDATSSHALLDLQPGPASLPCGERWESSVDPRPYPANPYDPAQFDLQLLVTTPSGEERVFHGFHDQPVIAVDRGDRAVFKDDGPPRFKLRFRATEPGRHRLRLRASWGDGTVIETPLPALQATGEAWDDIARVDPVDPRFFSAGGRFVWPLGCNLNSTYDVRSQQRLDTVLTPERGPFVREALLARLAAGGGTAGEVWLSPWNLGLEWIPDWPGFRGAGRYHAGNAAALDRLLAQAERLGMRLTLSIFNHGMGRAGKRREHDWRHHPYNRANGGWLDEPQGLFTDERAQTMQRRYFRYLVARYGDSPAVLGWKLWAEVNLTDAHRNLVLAWHQRTAAALDQLDPWDHPITTHWSGTWRTPDQRICALPEIDWITIDAYKNDRTAIADLLAESTGYPLSAPGGLAHHGKPLLVSEFGGSAGATAHERLLAEHRVGPWVGLVSGHAGSPMLWWFEWIDQHDHFWVYRPLRAFIAGEDLRDPAAASVALPVTGDDGCWVRAWVRPGHMLGYVLDDAWGRGEDARTLSNARLILSNDTAAGPMRLEWWSCDEGGLLHAQEFHHPGGRLEIPVPTFKRHLAFKLKRVGEE